MTRRGLWGRTHPRCACRRRWPESIRVIRRSALCSRSVESSPQLVRILSKPWPARVLWKGVWRCI